jgi:hypothetical protein
MNPSTRVSLRGEHLQNLHDYLHDPAYRLKWDEKQGYSAEFARRHDEIIRGIIENPKRPITIITGLDDICNCCGVCPRRDAHCVSARLSQKDRSVTSQYGLEMGREYKCKELVELVKTKERAKWPV